VTAGGRVSHGGWESVLETRQIYEAELAAGRLREAGLDTQVVDQSYRQEPVPSVRSFAIVRVLVPAEQAAEARRILTERTELPDGVELLRGAQSEET
jgi:hypothetical protein